MSAVTKKPASASPSDCAHRHKTGEFRDTGYRQTCDDCGADTTNEIEGAEAEAYMRWRRGELPH